MTKFKKGDSVELRSDLRNQLTDSQQRLIGEEFRVVELYMRGSDWLAAVTAADGRTISFYPWKLRHKDQTGIGVFNRWMKEENGRS